MTMKLIRIGRYLAPYAFALFALVCISQQDATAQAASSPMSVSQYSKFEASFTLPNQTGNPFDPADNDVDVTFQSAGAPPIVVPAFWDGDRWRVRFTPSRPGIYTLSIMRNGQAAPPADLAPTSLECVAAAAPGFVYTDPHNSQGFVFADGQPYYPLGMDVAWINGNGPGYSTYFAKMSQAHMNWARVWMTYWDGKALEWSPDPAKNPARGTFLLDAARQWDTIFDEAAQNGVYIQMVLQHHGQYTATTDPNWSLNPFNAANGGFLKKPDDFFTDPEAKRLTKAKYRYIVARYGYSTHLLAFELFNEVQNIREADTHFQDVVDWHKEMAAYIRSIDPYHHLITTSNSDPGTPLSQIGLDYNQIHTYPGDIISTFSATKTAGLATPTFYGEWGPGDQKNDMTAGFLHDGLWSSLVSPTAGAGQFWYWDQVLANNWWPEFSSATAFVQTLGTDKLGPLSAMTVGVTSPQPRADLSFAPPLGWANTTRTDIAILPGGQMPDVSGISSFIQGTSHRDMLPAPLVFHLNNPVPCQFRIRIDQVSQAGAHPTIGLDGHMVQEADYAPTSANQTVSKTLSVDVPAGPHTVSVFNTGPDWFTLAQATVTGYAPAVAALAKGNAHVAVFWAYARDRSRTAPLTAHVILSGLTPGPYRVRLWNPTTGQPAGTMLAKAKSGSLTVALPQFTGDIAGVVKRN